MTFSMFIFSEKPSERYERLLKQEKESILPFKLRKYRPYEPYPIPVVEAQEQMEVLSWWTVQSFFGGFISLLLGSLVLGLTLGMLTDKHALSQSEKIISGIAGFGSSSIFFITAVYAFKSTFYYSHYIEKLKKQIAGE